MKKVDFSKLIISLLLPQLARTVGAIFNGMSISTWYESLDKPSFNPPSWVFAPTWVVLYLLMGFSIYLIWEKKPKAKIIWVFWIHLIINATWSGLFFGLRSPMLAFIDIIVLWILIFILIEGFRRISRLAAYLLIPYLGWVTYAAFLNYVIWQLNL